MANENKLSIKPPVAVLGEVGEELSYLATVVTHSSHESEQSEEVVPLSGSA